MRKKIARGKPKKLTHAESDHFLTVLELHSYFLKIMDAEGVNKYSGIINQYPCYHCNDSSYLDFCINPSIVEEYLDTAYPNIASLLFYTVDMTEDQKVYLKMKWGDELFSRRTK